MPTSKTRIELDSVTLDETMPADVKAAVKVVAERLAEALPDHPQAAEIEGRLKNGQKVFWKPWESEVAIYLGPTLNVPTTALVLTTFPLSHLEGIETRAGGSD